MIEEIEWISSDERKPTDDEAANTVFLGIYGGKIDEIGFGEFCNIRSYSKHYLWAVVKGPKIESGKRIFEHG